VRKKKMNLRWLRELRKLHEGRKIKKNNKKMVENVKKAR
jgi:hypothetical protein